MWKFFVSLAIIVVAAGLSDAMAQTDWAEEEYNKQVDDLNSKIIAQYYVVEDTTKEAQWFIEFMAYMELIVDRERLTMTHGIDNATRVSNRGEDSTNIWAETYAGSIERDCMLLVDLNSWITKPVVYESEACSKSITGFQTTTHQRLLHSLETIRDIADDARTRGGYACARAIEEYLKTLHDRYPDTWPKDDDENDP